MGFSGGSEVKKPPGKQETCAQPLGGEDPLEKETLLTPVFWPGNCMDGGVWQSAYSPPSQRGWAGFSVDGAWEPGTHGKVGMSESERADGCLSDAHIFWCW